MKIKMFVALISAAAVTLLILTESGVLGVSQRQSKYRLFFRTIFLNSKFLNLNFSLFLENKNITQDIILTNSCCFRGCVDG